MLLARISFGQILKNIEDAAGKNFIWTNIENAAGKNFIWTNIEKY